MAIAWVQGKGANSGAATPTTLAVTLTSAVASGNTVCGSVCYGTTTTLTSVTDDKGNTYNLETGVSDTTNGQRTTGFSLSNITNGPKTITATMTSGVGATSLVADEFSGCGTGSTDQRDSSAHGAQWQTSPGTGANGVSSGPFTTVTNGDLLYGATSNDTGDDTGTLTAGTTTNATFALTSTSSGTSSGTCAMIKSVWASQSTAGASTAATLTQSVNVARVTVLIAVKPFVAGAAVGPVKLSGVPMGRMSRNYVMLNAAAPITVVVPPPAGGSTLPFMGVG